MQRVTITLDDDLMAMLSADSPTYRVGLFEISTGTELDTVSGDTEVQLGNVRKYEAEGRQWIIHPGDVIGSDQELVVREIIAGPAFDTADYYLMDASDGIIDNFVIVGNYIFGSGKTGMVTYRIDAI